MASSKTVREAIINNPDYVPKSLNLTKEELKTADID